MGESAPERRDRDELDDPILQSARHGDQAAFRELVGFYQQAVYQLLWRMLEHAFGQARVEELVQETFLRIFRSLPRFESSGPARLSTWIFTIATRLALNELRQRGRVVPIEDVTDRLVSTDRPDDALDRRRAASAVRAAVAALSPDHRAVFVLRDYHDLEYAEIADALEIDLGTVKSRLARARQALRIALKEVRHDH